MPVVWSCSKGHRWPLAQADRTVAIGVEAVCPECGSTDVKKIDVSAGLDASTSNQTIDQQPAPPPGDQTLIQDVPGKATRKPQVDKPAASNQATIASPQAKPGDKTQTNHNQGTIEFSPSKAPDRDDVDFSVTQAIDGKELDTGKEPGSDGDKSQLDDTMAQSPDQPKKRTVVVRSPGKAPATVAGYEILGVLGRGGMGVVYKARQVALDRLCALKMVIAGAHASPTDLMRFQVEAHAVAKLQHPNIVQIYDVGESDGHPYFSLEFVQGGALDEKLRGKPMAAQEAAILVRDLAHAMHYAHTRGIIHRDLKPANILLDVNGVPKITDFGLAKSLDDDSKNTGTGSIMGTPSYMAPEQAMGKTKEIGTLADIYSLGALLYDCMTGKPPFAGATVLDTLQQVKTKDPVAPRKVCVGVPADLETICLKCLEKEPNKRYSSAQALAEDLDRFLHDEPILARRVTAAERIIKWAKRHPAVAGLLSLLALVLVVGFLGMAVLYARAESSAFAAHKAKDDAIDAEKKATKAKNEAVLARNEAFTARNEAVAAEKVAVKAQDQAEQSEASALRNLYAASMNLARDAYLNARGTRLKELLEATKKKVGKNATDLRGFEWNYLANLYQSDRLTLKSHTQIVNSVAFRPPEQNEVASGSADGSVILWEMHDKKPSKYRMIQGHDGPVRVVAFSEDGRWLGSAGEDGIIKVWDLKHVDAGPIIMRGHEQAIQDLAFNTHRKLLASASEDESVRIWDLSTGKQIALLKGHEYGINDVAFSPDGRRVVSASKDRTVRVWDVDTQKEVFHPLKHQHWVTAVAFSPDGKLFATGGWEDKIRIFSASSGLLAFTLDDIDSPVTRIAFGPKGQRLACVCRDQSARVWRIDSKQLGITFPPEPGLFRGVAFSADGSQLASINFSELIQESTTRKTDSPLLALAFGATDEHFAGATTGGQIVRWDLKDKNATQTIQKKGPPTFALVYSPRRNEWASAGEDGKLHFWNADGSHKRTIVAHERWIHALAYSPDGKQLASASADRTVRIWKLADIDNPDVVPTSVMLEGHEGSVLALSYSPDGSLLASGSEDHSVKIWNTEPGKLVESFKGEHRGPVQAVAFGRDGRTLASAGWDRLIRIWNVETGTLVRELQGHIQSVNALAYSPDGSRLASGSSDRSVKLWDVKNGLETLTLTGHTDSITAVAFSPSGSHLASAGWDGMVRIWHAGTTTPANPSPGAAIHATPGNLANTTANSDTPRQ